MPGANDSDLKEILARFDKMDQKFDKKFEQIDQKFAQIDQKFEQIDKKFEQIDKKLDKIEDKIDNAQKDIIDIKISQGKLEEKINGVEKRLENQEFLNRTVVAGLVLALLANVVKMLIPNLLT